MQSAEVWQSLRGADWFSWIRLTHLTFHLGAVWNRALPTHSVMLNLNELDGINTSLNRCLLVAYMILFNNVFPEGVYRVYTFAVFQVSMDMHACRIVFLHTPCLLCVCIMSICMNAFMQACEWTFGLRVTDPFVGVNMCVRACRHGQSTMAVTLTLPVGFIPLSLSNVFIWA